MAGSGAAISVKEAEGVCGEALRTQRNPWLYLGCFQEITPSSLHSLTCFRSVTAFRLVFLTADGADVAIFAGVGGTMTVIPSATDLNFWVRWVGARLLVCRS